jgi:hypothetical protein
VHIPTRHISALKNSTADDADNADQDITIARPYLRHPRLSAAKSSVARTNTDDFLSYG